MTNQMKNQTTSSTPIQTDANKFTSLFSDPNFRAVWNKQQDKKARNMRRAWLRKQGIDRS